VNPKDSIMCAVLMLVMCVALMLVSAALMLIVPIAHEQSWRDLSVELGCAHYDEQTGEFTLREVQHERRQ